MSSYFYIKLFHEILHDPKMGRLTDNLWRRVIEVFLLAGENGRDGYLPAVEDMAWELRLSVEELEANLQALSKYNIVSLTTDGWHVTHFEKRQAPIEDKERVSAHRDRAKKQAYYATETDETQTSNADVTTRYTELDIDIDKELELEKSKKIAANAATPLPRAVQTYINNGGGWQQGKLKDGTSKKQHCFNVIAETVKDTDDSITFWGRVVYAYCLQWSSKSYTVMLNEYYLKNRLPGQNGQNGNGVKNGNTTRRTEPEYTQDELDMADEINAKRRAKQAALRDVQ